MSSFLISDNTINNLVTFFIKCSYSSYVPYCYINHIIKDELNLNLNYIDDKNPNAQILGYEMVKLNHLALKYRYNDKLKFNYTFKEGNLNNSHEIKYLYQILKSLNCFLYQCNKGNNNKKKLFKVLTKISNTLMNYLINENEFYKESEWC